MRALNLVEWSAIRSAGTGQLSAPAYLVGWLQRSALEGAPLTTLSDGWREEALRANESLDADPAKHPPALLDSLEDFLIQRPDPKHLNSKDEAGEGGATRSHDKTDKQTDGAAKEKNGDEQFFHSVFLSALADPDVLKDRDKQIGKEWLLALKKAVSSEDELRLLRLEEDSWLATYKAAQELYLLCPHSGLWNLGGSEAKTNFYEHMERYYSTKAGTRCSLFVVPKPTLVHVTWVGPPSTSTKLIRNKTIELRPDIDGPRLMDRALTASDRQTMNARRAEPFRPHRVIFHCLAEFKKRFQDLLEDTHIRVWAIEDQVNAEGAEVGWTKDRLPETVALIVAKSIELQAKREVKRDAVNVKNVWSLYTMWRYGGYHLDSGIIPTRTESSPGTKAPVLSSGTTVSLPAPTEFQMPNQLGPGGQGMAKLQLAFYPKGGPGNIIANDVVLVRLLLGTDVLAPEEVGQLLVLADMSKQSSNYNGDVWMVRSNRGNPRAFKALQVYAQLWFRADRLRLSKSKYFGDLYDPDELHYQGVCRFLVTAAYLTGVGPQDDREFWVEGNLGRMMDGHQLAYTLSDSGGARVESLDVDKVFFMSHGA